MDLIIYINNRIVNIEKVGIDAASIQILELTVRLMWAFPLVRLRLGLFVLLTSTRFT